MELPSCVIYLLSCSYFWVVSSKLPVSMTTKLFVFSQHVMRMISQNDPKICCDASAMNLLFW